MKIKQILEGLTDEQVDQFHTELDELVHKHLGHSSDEEDVKESEEDPYYASQTIMDEDPPLGINYDYANLPKVNWDKYSTKAIKKFLSVIENLDFESGYYGDFDDFDVTHFNAAQWIEKNVLAKRQDESVKESEEALTEAQFDEAAGEKDACYRKVKSRYKVWPSAYASGALVKCRKVGAKNWGNSKK